MFAKDSGNARADRIRRRSRIRFCRDDANLSIESTVAWPIGEIPGRRAHPDRNRGAQGRLSFAEELAEPLQMFHNERQLRAQVLRLEADLHSHENKAWSSSNKM